MMTVVVVTHQQSNELADYFDESDSDATFKFLHTKYSLTEMLLSLGFTDVSVTVEPSDSEEAKAILAAASAAGKESKPQQLFLSFSARAPMLTPPNF